jgi:ABC-type multidrug transport system ATPase subunit
VFLVDEPTRGVDVGAKEEIYRVLRSQADRGAGVVCVSSELDEILENADRVLAVRNGAIVRDFGQSVPNMNTLLHSLFGHEPAHTRTRARAKSIPPQRGIEPEGGAMMRQLSSAASGGRTQPTPASTLIASLHCCCGSAWCSFWRS